MYSQKDVDFQEVWKWASITIRKLASLQDQLNPETQEKQNLSSKRIIDIEKIKEEEEENQKEL